MPENLYQADALSNSEQSIDRRFLEFKKIIDRFGLSTFAKFVMHKNFEHTDMDALSNAEKEILIDECRPLLVEALQQSKTLQ